MLTVPSGFNRLTHVFQLSRVSPDMIS